MLIHVLMGNAGDCAQSQLQQERDRLAQAGKDHSIVNAGAYAGDGLLSILEVRFHAGQREILVDDCTRAQIFEVLAWQSCVEDDDRFNDLVVHLARRN